MVDFDSNTIAFLPPPAQLRIARTFLTQLQGCASILTGETSGSMRRKIEILAHSMRGSSMAFGIRDLAAACETLEEAAGRPGADIADMCRNVANLAGKSAASLQSFVDELQSKQPIE